MSQPLLLRVVASSVAVANKAGQIIRDILKSGDLGIVQKVYHENNQKSFFKYEIE